MVATPIVLHYISITKIRHLSYQHKQKGNVGAAQYTGRHLIYDSGLHLISEILVPESEKL